MHYKDNARYITRYRKVIQGVTMHYKVLAGLDCCLRKIWETTFPDLPILYLLRRYLRESIVNDRILCSFSPLNLYLLPKVTARRDITWYIARGEGHPWHLGLAKGKSGEIIKNHLHAILRIQMLDRRRVNFGRGARSIVEVVVEVEVEVLVAGSGMSLGVSGEQKEGEAKHL